MEAKAMNWHHERGRSEATIQWKMKLPLESIYLTFCSVFRPAGYVDSFPQEPRLLWDFAERDDLFWARPGGSHRPPCTPIPTAARAAQRFPQSSRLRIGAVAYPFRGTHGLWIVSARHSPDCDQDIMNSLLVVIAIVSEPPSCGYLYFVFIVLIEGHQCVRVFGVHGQTS